MPIKISGAISKILFIIEQKLAQEIFFLHGFAYDKNSKNILIELFTYLPFCDILLIAESKVNKFMKIGFW